MEVIFILLTIGLTVTTGFLISFLWAVKKGQYEDTFSPSVRILFDEFDKSKIKSNKPNHKTSK